MARTIAIWISGLVASGIAGSVVALALLHPINEWQLVTFAWGLLGGVLGFTCLRLWLANPRDGLD